MAQLEKRTLAGYPRPYHSDIVEITIDRLNQKLVVMSPNDSEYDEAVSREGVPGKLLIISHGSEDSAGGGLDVLQMSRLIRETGLWRPGLPIVHDACNIGRGINDFAQQMSNQMGVAYTGPTSYSWRKWQIIGGGSLIADTAVGGNFPNLFSRGSWRTFYPKYVEVNARQRR